MKTYPESNIFEPKSTRNAFLGKNGHDFRKILMGRIFQVISCPKCHNVSHQTIKQYGSI